MGHSDTWQLEMFSEKKDDRIWKIKQEIHENSGKQGKIGNSCQWDKFQMKEINEEGENIGKRMKTEILGLRQRLLQVTEIQVI